MLLKQRKNKKFNYKSRYRQDDTKLYDDIADKWKQHKKTDKKKSFNFTSMPFLIVLLVMALILWYILQMYE